MALSCPVVFSEPNSPRHGQHPEPPQVPLPLPDVVREPSHSGGREPALSQAVSSQCPLNLLPPLDALSLPALVLSELDIRPEDWLAGFLDEEANELF